MMCIASVNIPEGTLSTPFRAGGILTNPLGESRGNVRINFLLQIGVTASGELQPVAEVPVVFWPKPFRICAVADHTVMPQQKVDKLSYLMHDEFHSMKFDIFETSADVKTVPHILEV